MQALTPLPARTALQLLRRLDAHFRGTPIPPGHPLTPIAKAMPLVEREAEVVFLGKPKSNWIAHTILVLDGKVILDHNPYLTSRFADDKYTAVELAGRPVTLEVRRRISVEDFIRETELYDRFRTSEPSPEELEEQSND